MIAEGVPAPPPPDAAGVGSHGVRGELKQVVRALRGGWARGRWAAFTLATVAAGLTGIFAFAEHTRLRDAVVQVAGVRQSDRLAVVLLRTPLSIFASAPNLPAWGAIAQVLIVVAIAEVVLGSRRTIIVGLGAELLVNLAVHSMIVAGHGSWLGVTGSGGLDTGPSVVVVALACAAACELPARFLGFLTATALVVEAVVLSDLAGHEHVLGLVAGLLLWWVTGGRVVAAANIGRASRSQRHRRAIRRVTAACVAGVGVGALISALAAPRRHHHRIAPVFSIGAEHFANGVVAAGGVGLIVLSRGLLRGQRRAWALASTLLASVAIAQVVKGRNMNATAASFGGLVLLIAATDSFRARTDRHSSVKALRGAAVALIVAFLSALVAVEAFTAYSQHQPRLAVGAAARIVLESLLGWRHGRINQRAAGFLHAGVFGVAASVALVSLWSVLRPVLAGAHGAELQRLDQERARRIVATHGGGTLDYFTLRDDKNLFFWGETVVGYTVRFGVCVVSPDPVGPPAEHVDAWAAFMAYADQQGWIVAVLAAAERWLPIYRSYGMSTLYAGDEAVVDASTFSLEGGERKSLRQAINRVARHGYTVTFHDPAHVSAELAASLRSLMSKSRRGGVERGFSMTLGRIFGQEDRGLLLAVCTDAAGEPAAFCQFVPSPGINGWSLDLMRRDTGDHPNGLLDAVIVETIRHVAGSGGGGIALNFATMRAVLAEQAPSGPLRSVQRWVLRRLSDDMQIMSLWHFNAKYGPSWVPRYIAIDGAEHTLVVAMAIASAESMWELPVIGRWLHRPAVSHERPVPPATVNA